MDLVEAFCTLLFYWQVKLLNTKLKISHDGADKFFMMSLINSS